jgi:ribosomal protein S18 acetylase RimI-like enzyme
MSLAQLRGKAHSMDLGAASAELSGYLEKGFPIYAAESETGTLVGYLVCRVDGDVVWVESLYVTPEYRRQGVGSSLYAEAERLAQEMGGDSLYNWVDPNNDMIIRFLRRRGYTILNLIELRRPRPGENPSPKIAVGLQEFDSH